MISNLRLPGVSTYPLNLAYHEVAAKLGMEFGLHQAYAPVWNIGVGREDSGSFMVLFGHTAWNL